VKLNVYSKSAHHSAEQSFLQVRKVYKIFLNTRITQGSDFERMLSGIEMLSEIHRYKNVMLNRNSTFMLWPEHCSVKIPTAGQCFPFQIKMIYT